MAREKNDAMTLTFHHTLMINPTPNSVQSWPLLDTLIFYPIL